MDDFFAPPAFKPAEALILLKRSLRDLHALSERGNAFEWKGHSVIDLSADAQVIHARLVRRPARTPDWTTHTLKASPDLRRFVETVKRELERWDRED